MKSGGLDDDKSFFILKAVSISVAFVSALMRPERVVMTFVVSS